MSTYYFFLQNIWFKAYEPLLIYNCLLISKNLTREEIIYSIISLMGLIDG